MAADLVITTESLRTWVRKKDESQALPERREADRSPAEELARLRAAIAVFSSMDRTTATSGGSR
ncbi:hypothetical protein [Streptomyces sp. NPDC002676]